MTSTSIRDRIARDFVTAREQGARMAAYPGEFPLDLQAAYEIQDAAISLYGRGVLGWKVGRVAPEWRARFGRDRIAGPIFSVVDARRAPVAEMPTLPGFAAVEAEILLRVRGRPPAGLDPQSVMEFIDEARFGLEIASSPFPHVNDHGPAVTASDFGNNFGLLIGEAIEPWRDAALDGLVAAVAIDGADVGAGTVASGWDGPFGAAAFLIDCLNERGAPLADGAWISTGALTGVHAVRPGQLVSASLASARPLQCRIGAFVRQPRMTPVT